MKLAEEGISDSKKHSNLSVPLYDSVYLSVHMSVYLFPLSVCLSMLHLDLTDYSS